MNKSLKTTIKKLAPAVLTSLIATSLGLLSLSQSKVPMIQDFGMMLAIGIAVAFVLALFILLPVLILRTKLVEEKDTKKQVTSSRYVRIIKTIAKRIIKLKYVILVFAIILAGTGFYLDQKVDVETDMETFMPQDSEALADINHLRDLVGSTDRIVIFYEADDITSYQTLLDVASLTTMLETDYKEDIEMKASVTMLLNQVSNKSWDASNYDMYLSNLPEEQLRLLQSTTDNQGVINIALKDMDDATFNTFLEDLNRSIDDLSLSTKTTITGQSVIEQSMLDSMTSDRLTMTLIGIGLVFIALLVIYRNFFKAIIIVLPIIFIVGWSGGIMYLLGFDYTPLTSTLGALIIGIGTEFTILIVMRFYEFKETIKDHTESIVNAVGLMGKPIIVSAVTTMGGFSALIFSDFAILSNFGIMTLVNISLALLSSLIVLPALLAVTHNKQKIQTS